MELEPNAHIGNLWQGSIDRSTATMRGGLVRLTQLTETKPKDLSATEDGRRLAFLRERSQSDVLLAELEEGGRRITGVKHLTRDERVDEPLAWAPSLRRSRGSMRRGRSRRGRASLRVQ
jgi:hypothetical protein